MSLQRCVVPTKRALPTLCCWGLMEEGQQKPDASRFCRHEYNPSLSPEMLIHKLWDADGEEEQKPLFQWEPTLTSLPSMSWVVLPRLVLGITNQEMWKPGRKWPSLISQRSLRDLGTKWSWSYLLLLHSQGFPRSRNPWKFPCDLGSITSRGLKCRRMWGCKTWEEGKVDARGTGVRCFF